MLLPALRLWQESTGGILKLHLLAFDRVEAERSMITPLLVPSTLPRSLRPRRRKAPGSPVFFDPDCCYLYVDVSYEPAVEDSPEKCGWDLHVVRANVVQGQFCSPISFGLVRENTRVSKLSNNLAELVAIVHAFEYVLSQPSGLRYMICFDLKYAAHVVAGEEPLGSGQICWRPPQML